MKRKLILLLLVYTFLSVKAMAQLPAIAFEAVINNQQNNPISPFRFDVVKYNQGNAFSERTNMFVAPANGVYFFTVNFLWDGFGCGYNGGTLNVAAVKNAGETLYSIKRFASYHEWGTFTTAFSFSTKLNAGDRVSLTSAYTFCTGSAVYTSHALLHKGSFSGYRVYADQ
ncbi:MAG: hypothetical protein ABIP30_10300 [Ferruginibacter sp.]